MDESSAFERQVAREVLRVVGPVRPVDAAAVFAAVARSRQRPWSKRIPEMSRLLVAAAVVSLFGGLLVVGLVRLEQRDAAMESPSPVASTPIHWRSDVVDLAADAFSLELEGRTFTAATSDFLVRANPGDERSWTLEVDWGEHDRVQRFYVYFGADDTDWWIDELRTYDGRVPSEWVIAEGPFLRTPLGTTATGDLHVELVGEGRPGAPDDIVRGSLSIDGLRLSVLPGAGATAAPDPVTEGYGEGTLTGVPDGDGFLVVHDDGAGHDLDARVMDVAVAPDGTVWAALHKRVFRVGEPGEISTLLGVPAFIETIAPGPDGSVLLAGGKRRASDELAIADGSGLRALPPFDAGPPEASRDVHDPVFAPDGSLWTGVAGGVARLADGAWTYHPLADIAPLAAAARSAEDAQDPVGHVAVAPDGSVWIGDRGSLARFDGAAWEETRLLEVAGATDSTAAVTEGLAVGPDGTLWAIVGGASDHVGVRPWQLVRNDAAGWSAVALADLLPAVEPWSSDIAVDADGALLAVVGVDASYAEPGDASGEVIRTDGRLLERLGSIGEAWEHPLALEVGTDGSVWVVAGELSGRLRYLAPDRP